MGVFYVSGERSPLLVGRDPRSDLLLTDPVISRMHLRFITVTHDVAAVEVLGGNGAEVKGIQLNKGQKCHIRAGDRVRIGDRVIVWTGKSQRAPESFVSLPARGPFPMPEPLEIEGPPPRRVPEKPSVMLAAGPALTMAIPIVLGAGRTVAVLSSVFAAVWAALNVSVRVRKQKAEERRRRNTYMSYIAECEKTIKERVDCIRSDMCRLYPETGEYIKNGADPCIMWNSLPDEEGSIRVRTGIGNIRNPLDIVIPKERFASIDDSLRDIPGRIRDRYETINACPYLEKLTPGTITGFYIGGEDDRQMLSAFIMQLAMSFSPSDLKITVSVDAEMARYFMWTSVLPHTRAPDGYKMNVVITDDDLFAFSSLAQNPAVLVRRRDESFPAGVDRIVNGANKDIDHDRLVPELAFSYAAQLSGLWSGRDDARLMPESVPLGMLFCVRGAPGEYISTLSCFIRRNYEKNDITSEISAPIGLKTGEERVFLDLHEKAQGPHGLIAGTTGSGKSELLTTMILSFASRYPADKLAFFLIDYKGGGMSNLFSKLPHLIGNISNLSRTDARRAMIALKSENVRRQRIFAEAGVNSINGYTKLYDDGVVKLPLPHVLIIVDEFAELRKEEPDFMDCLISVSQIGRSLGMHLILATQKPAGVVDDRIRSNSGFRIALRLVDRSDSMDIIGRADAADIKESGRACLQTGPGNDITVFQSGYAMCPVSPAGERPRIYDSFLLENEIVQERRDEFSANTTWFELLMKAIIACSDKKKPEKLFLPSLPAHVHDDRAFAVYDNPYEQKYGLAMYEPKEMGHVLISGRSGSGKSELAGTLVRRLNGNFAVYVVDFGGGVLKSFSACSWCGGYVTDEEPEDILRMALFLSDELTARRKGFGNCPADAVLVLDDLIGIRKAGPEAYEHILRILTLGKSAGITVIATADGGIPAREERLFDTGLFLGNEEAYKIAGFLKAPARDVPEAGDFPGRGVGLFSGRALEFQAVKEDGPCINPAGIVAPHFPHVPQKPSLEELLTRSIEERGALAGFPVGYEEISGRIYDLPLKDIRCLLVGGRPYKGRHTFLFIISAVAARYGRTCVNAVTYEGFISACREGADVVISGCFEDLLDGFYGEKRSSGEEEEMAGYFENPKFHTGDEKKRPLVAAVIGNDAGIRFAGRKIYEAAVRNPYAVCFGGSLDENRNFDFSYLAFSEIQKSHNRGIATVIKYDEKTYHGPINVPMIFDVDNSQIQ
ncbi:MAG: FHA domain-containing protein [Lachnospiraceae bacterium]|nr:FHA domain-containing protein [Lachnospiraceae bacterium]